MHVRNHNQLTLTFERDELRLVGLALINRLRDKKDIQAALVLNKRIQEQYAKELRNELELVEGRIAKIDEEHTPKQDTTTGAAEE